MPYKGAICVAKQQIGNNDAEQRNIVGYKRDICEIPIISGMPKELKLVPKINN